MLSVCPWLRGLASGCWGLVSRWSLASRCWAFGSGCWYLVSGVLAFKSLGSGCWSLSEVLCLDAESLPLKGLNAGGFPPRAGIFHLDAVSFV